MLRNIFKQFAALTVRTVNRSYCAEAEENPRRGREKYVNSVTLLGRVGRDSELRGVGDNQVLVFSLATNPNYDTGADKAEWHRILVSNFRLRDSLVNRIEKGDRILVIGRIQYNQYIDAQQIKKTSAIVVANDVILVNKSRYQRKKFGDDDGLEDVTRQRQRRRFSDVDEDVEEEEDDVKQTH